MEVLRTRYICVFLGVTAIYFGGIAAQAACVPGDTTPLVVAGTAADDLLQGCEGNDDLSGGPGQDYLRGNAGNDILKGDDGDDILRGGPGKDAYFGGDGGDRVSFYDFTVTQGVIANLATQKITNDGFGNKETMNSIESLGAGTRFADVFRGDAGDNGIIGVGAGDDARGGGGNDRFQIDDAGGAFIAGGAGVDCACFFTQSRLVDDGAGGTTVENTTKGVHVDLSLKKIVDDGWSGSGNLTGFENLGGSIGADTLVGNGGANEITGDAGDDAITGRAGNDKITGGVGADTLDGGAGADIYVYSTILDSVSGASDVVTFRPLHNDKIDLSAIDADAGTSGSAFAFIAAENPVAIANSVTWFKDKPNKVTIVRASDGVSELVITLQGLVDLTAADFDL